VVQVEGSSRHLKLYEVHGPQSDAIRERKGKMRGRLEAAMTLYFGKDFAAAYGMLKEMRDGESERSDRDGWSDSILPYYLSHCESWLDAGPGLADRIAHWDGVHVFTEK
jgi:hypothetical protein